MKTIAAVSIVLVVFFTDPSLAGRFRSLTGESRQNVSACLANCVDEQEDVHPNLGDDTAFTFVNLSRIKAYCTVYDLTKTCAENCGNEDFQEFLENYKARAYVCLQSNLTAYAPCYMEVLNAARTECTSGAKCGAYMQTPAQQEDSTALLKRRCNKWKCGLDCVKPALVTKCGQPAFDTLKTATIKVARSSPSYPKIPECGKLRNV